MKKLTPSDLFYNFIEDSINTALAHHSPPPFEILEGRLWSAAEHDAFIVGRESRPLRDRDGQIRAEAIRYVDLIKAAIMRYRELR